ncbi:MAG: alpha/beta hydrolase [Clostridia bacterium]|nr:alpha/beta hydrolase [Clostridia bacterium]
MPVSYPLWNENVPHFNPDYNQPAPEMTYYPAENPKGCVVVLPGGGYAMRADHEGEPIARRYNELGFASFVVSYRVAPYRHPVPLTDSQRAVRMARWLAPTLGYPADKIAILGFSAGGHLTVSTVEHFGEHPAPVDEIDRISCRPDAGILCYPVVSLGEYTHVGSLHNLLGEHPDKELVKKLSGEISVRPDMPPVFMWHTADDPGVPVENSLYLAAAMRRAQIPFELHVFPHGPHGLGLATGIPGIEEWTKLSAIWLESLK